jgi:hypothetical protein
MHFFELGRHQDVPCQTDRALFGNDFALVDGSQLFIFFCMDGIWNSSMLVDERRKAMANCINLSDVIAYV